MYKIDILNADIGALIGRECFNPIFCCDKHLLQVEAKISNVKKKI